MAVGEKCMNRHGEDMKIVIKLNDPISLGQGSTTDQLLVGLHWVKGRVLLSTSPQLFSESGEPADLDIDLSAIDPIVMEQFTEALASELSKKLQPLISSGTLKTRPNPPEWDTLTMEEE